MPKIKDHEANKRQLAESKRRIDSALNDEGFWRSLDIFKSTWEARGCPSLFDVFVLQGNGEKESHFDNSIRCVVYSGLYYDLRELCDAYHLMWPVDGKYVMQLIIAKYDHSAITPNECPPREHWQWFRMARAGLGLPRDKEVDTAQKVSNQAKRARNPSRGFVYDEIAKQAQVEVRTVQEAIKKCWQYLERGVYLNPIADLAGLDDSETLYLMMVLEWRRFSKGIPEE